MSLVWSLALALAPPPSAPPPPAAAARRDVAPVPAAPGDAPFDAQAYLREGPLAAALAARPGGLTADRIAERAVAASPMVAVKESQIQAAAAQLDKTMYAFLPQVSGKIGYTRLSKADINFANPGGVTVAGAGAPTQSGQTAALGPCMDNPLNICAYDTATGASTGQVNLIAYGPSSLQISIPLNSYSMQAQIALPISDYILSLLPAKRGSQARRDAVALARDAERVKVETDARLAYYNWLRTVAAVVAVEDSLRRVKARQQDVANLFEAGAATKAEVMRIDAQIAQIEQAINDAATLRATTEQALAIMLDDPRLEFVPGEDVIDLPPDLPNVGSLEAMIREAQTSRLEMKSLEKSIGGLQHGINATRAGYFPRLDGFAEATYANPNQRFFPLEQKWRASWSVGLQLSYSMNQALNARAEIQTYKANKREMYAQAEALRRGIAMEVTQAYLARNKALADLQLSARALEAAVEAYRVASELFAAGSATTNDIIDAENDQLTAILRIINTRIDLRVANARLVYATGRIKPSTIGNEAAPATRK